MSAVLLAVAASTCLASSGQQAEEGGGFQSNHIFLNGPGGDSISPFSGDAEVPVSIGPTLKAGGGLELGLTLHYSTKIWSIWTEADPALTLKRRGPFGVGWRLHVGRLYASCRNNCDLNAGTLLQKEWVYESPDGAQHPIEFGVKTGPDPNFSYNGTTDSTYMRVEPQDSNSVVLDPNANASQIAKWKVFMGNGVITTLERRLDVSSVDLNHGSDLSDDFRGWYTTSIDRVKDTNPSQVVGRIEVTYGTGSTAHCLSQINFKALVSGSLTTQRSITFSNATSLYNVTIEGGYTYAINFPAVSGQEATTATYNFEYLDPNSLTFAPDPNISVTHDNQLLLWKIKFPFPSPADPNTYPDLPPISWTPR